MADLVFRRAWLKHEWLEDERKRARGIVPPEELVHLPRPDLEVEEELPLIESPVEAWWEQ